jgi:invasion protein IalB
MRRMRLAFGPAVIAALALLPPGAFAAPATMQTAQNTAPRPPAARGQSAPPLAQAPIAQPPAAAPIVPTAPAVPGVGEAAPAPAAVVPTRTEILNFDNWVVTCNEFAEGPRTRVCSALLRIIQEKTAQIVFSWTVAVDTNKQMVTVMQTPTGVAIAPGVELRIGKAAPRKIPFTSCETGRCVASVVMDAALLRDLTTTPTAEAVIQGSQGNNVQFNIQMKGFDKAYAILSRS